MDSMVRVPVASSIEAVEGSGESISGSISISAGERGKFRLRAQHSRVWACRYFVSTVGRDEHVIREYIRERACPTRD